jgi:23S rRNA (guanosine2251-2'-O)-methyltransferase
LRSMDKPDFAKLSMEELNRLDAASFKSTEKTPIYLVLDNIRSLYNVGSVFRTADAFRVAGIFICGITATPPHREIQKTALGATETVHWEHFPDTLSAVNALKDKGCKIVVVEQVKHSIMLQDFIPEANRPIALVFGNEVNGVDDQILAMADSAVEIPQFGTKHSLNIAVSAAIVIWELWRKMPQ